MLLTTSTYLHADPALRNSSRSLREERTETREPDDVVTIRIYENSENQIVAVAVVVRLGKSTVRSYFLPALVVIPVYFLGILLTLMGLMEMSLLGFLLWFISLTLLFALNAYVGLLFRKLREAQWTMKKAQSILENERRTT
jgi:hypothetical protein